MNEEDPMGYFLKKLALYTIAMLYIVLLAGILTGCDMPEFYRYQCMDSKNWDKPACKRPECEILGECPDQLMKPELTKGQNNER
jgi:hypothetical protein